MESLTPRKLSTANVSSASEAVPVLRIPQDNGRKLNNASTPAAMEMAIVST